MASFLRTALISLALLGSSAFASENDIQTGGRTYGNQDESYRVSGVPHFQGFEPYDLSFALPSGLRWQRNYFSENFFAVMLESQAAVADDGPSGGKNCSGYFTESQRAKTQRQFPGKKVFASRVGCSSAMVGYTNFNTTYNFIAVYGGTTMAEANAVVKQANGLGYRGANIRKMQVILFYGD